MMRLKIELNRKAPLPLSRQIYQAIADRIASGLLEEGHQLPSVRNLSKQLNVSMVTVSKAYGLLSDDRLIRTIHGKGSYINGSSAPLSSSKSDQQSSLEWQLFVPDYLPRAQFWHQNHSVTLPEHTWLSGASVHPSLLPEKLISKHLSALLLEDAHLLSEYGSAEGEPSFRAAVADYLTRDGLSVTEKDVIITSGSQQAINLVARTFIKSGDVVIMEAPTYTAAIDVFRWQGASILTVPVDKEGMRTDLLLQLCERYSPTLIYTIPTYHNPTASVMSLSRRKALIDISNAFNCLILEDDPWHEISFEKVKWPSLKSLDKNGHVIYVKGFSKFLAPGCRLGALTTSGSLLSRLIAAKSNSDLGSPWFIQKALSPFLHPPFMKKHLKQMNRQLLDRRNLVLKILKQHMPKGVKWNKPMGGPNIWLTLPESINVERLILESQKRNIAFLAGSTCYANEPEQNHIRLSFSALPLPELERGLVLLCEMVSES